MIFRDRIVLKGGCKLNIASWTFSGSKCAKVNFHILLSVSRFTWKKPTNQRRGHLFACVLVYRDA